MRYLYIMTRDVEFPPNHRPGTAGDLRDPRRPATAHGHLIRAGQQVAPHAHPRAQLALTLTGVMRLEAGHDTWIVPPSHAVWVPGGQSHSIRSETDIVTCNVFVDPSCATRARPETRPTVLRLSALSREMAVRLSEAGAMGQTPARGGATAPWRRLGLSLIDEIARLETSALGLPGGRDPRLVQVTAHLNRTPGEVRGLPELAAGAGTSERTLARLFRAETGLSFRQWRNRQRMLVALERLERGESSSAVAEVLGYGSASAFIAAFRRTLGAAPRQFTGATGGRGAASAPGPLRPLTPRGRGRPGPRAGGHGQRSLG